MGERPGLTWNSWICKKKNNKLYDNDYYIYNLVNTYYVLKLAGWLSINLPSLCSKHSKSAMSPFYIKREVRHMSLTCPSIQR